jgi:hypothetical protein
VQPLYNQAACHAALADKERAVDTLRGALELQEALGRALAEGAPPPEGGAAVELGVVAVMEDPDFDGLHGFAPFEALIMERSKGFTVRATAAGTLLLHPGMVAGGLRWYGWGRGPGIAKHYGRVCRGIPASFHHERSHYLQPSP